MKDARRKKIEEASGIQMITCGPPKHHECDSDGPVVCGGENKDGTHWEGLASITENRMRSTWGSVSCSKCGMTAMDLGMWRGP